MRSTEEQLERLACAEHCRFFKPWAEEQPSCAAHHWLLKRISLREETLEHLEKLRGVKPRMPFASDALLLRTVCTHCEYYPYQCNYRNPAGPSRAVPCGGLTVLALLLERGEILTQELYEPPWSRTEAGEP